VSDGRLAVLLDTHTFTVHGMSRDGLVDRTAARQYTTADREVMPRYRSFRQLAHQCRMRLQGLCDQQEPGRILVDTMDDPGPWHLLQLRSVVQQAIHQRATRVARPRMDDQASRLVDDQQVLILIHNIQRYGLWFGTHFALDKGLELNDLPARNGIAGPLRAALDPYRTCQQPFLEPTA